jgi:RluA family pseudouridine synthase
MHKPFSYKIDACKPHKIRRHLQVPLDFSLPFLAHSKSSEKNRKTTMQTKEYRVTRTTDGQTLQEFVSNHLKISRNTAKKLLDRRRVFVNGKRIWMTKHNLKTGDEISILLEDPPQKGHTNTRKALRILWQDDHYIIVNKPANLLSVGAASVETRLRDQLGDHEIRAVHRLDRDTTGCLIFARNKASFDQILPLFRDRNVSKTYHAIVHGHMKTGEHRISKPLGGQTAVSHVRVLDASDAAAHVSVKIETGRTHQIRIHLSSFKHPVMGDAKYAGEVERKAGILPIPRQMLHARTLVFKHPATQELLRIEAPLPKDFRDCLRSFKLT